MKMSLSRFAVVDELEALFLDDDDQDDLKLVALVEVLINQQPDEFFSFLQLDTMVRKQEKKLRVRRNRLPNLWESGWGRMILDPSIEDPTSYLARKFRRRFRMPFPLFKQHIDDCKQHNIFELKYQSKIDVEFRVLASLRILGRDACGDDIEELIDIGDSTARAIFKAYLVGCKNYLFPLYVKPPTGDVLKEVQETYARLGLPGAVGSMDCTHIYWDKCPASWTNNCTGKEKSPTLVFQVVCDHSTRIHHVSNWYPGTNNDIQVTNQDTYPMELIRGTHYANEVFTLRTRDGNTVRWMGAYLIVDGGYHKYTALIDPMKHVFSIDEVLWSEWIESVRKDVERLFSHLKNRFRFLKNAVKYHDAEVVENAIKTASVLHNMILEFEGRTEFHWEDANPDEEEPINYDDLNNNWYAPEDNAQIVEDWLRFGIDEEEENEEEVLPPPIPFKAVSNYESLRKALVAHFTHEYMHGRVRWPRRFKNWQKESMPIPEAVDIRALQESTRSLFIAPSNLKALNPVTKMYSSPVGNGLFCRLKILPGNRIARFNGEQITQQEKAHRIASNPACERFIVDCTSIVPGTYMDCSHSFAHGNCIASFANSPYRAYNEAKNEWPVANARLLVGMGGTDRNQLQITLFCQRKIEPREEILYDYLPVILN